MTHKVAAIFAHPDDEVLGAGAALAAHAMRGDEVRILILATGLAARGAPTEGQLQALRGEAQAAAGILGARDIAFADFPDNQMDSVPLLAVVRKVEEFLDGFPAETIYTHHSGDLNVDHGVTARAVLTAARPLPNAPPRAILACEVNSATEYGDPHASPFLPTLFVDASETIERKLEALAAYGSELRDWPHPRSLEGVRVQAARRGSQSGMDSAEAFQFVRMTTQLPI